MQEMIDQILVYLRDRTGHDFSGNQSSMIMRRLKARLATVGAASHQDYLDYLKQDDNELNNLIESLTVNVTQFFRDSLTWEYLNHQLLPGIFAEKAKSNDDALRIWSAGCASGEEAYSAALLFNEYIEKEKLNIVPMIFATDINHSVLNFARSGVYASPSLSNMKYGILQKYFSPVETKFEISSEIKSYVSFSKYDMLEQATHFPSESIYGAFDMVFCRNLLIYFKPEPQEIILEKLYHSLTHRGLLILGESERPVGKFKGKFQELTNMCRIYRKL